MVVYLDAASALAAMEGAWRSHNPASGAVAEFFGGKAIFIFYVFVLFDMIPELVIRKVFAYIVMFINF